MWPVRVLVKASLPVRPGRAARAALALASVPRTATIRATCRSASELIDPSWPQATDLWNQVREHDGCGEIPCSPSVVENGICVTFLELLRPVRGRGQAALARRRLATS